MPGGLWGKKSGSSSARGGRSGRQPRRSSRGKWFGGPPEAQQQQQQPTRKRKGWWGSISGSSGKQPPKDVDTGHLDWARQAALHTLKTGNGTRRSTLVRVRTRIPWRASSGKSHTLHPFRIKAFWRRHFGQGAVLLRRGARHRPLLSVAEATGLLQDAKLGVDADMMGPQMWNSAARRPNYQPEYGLPAVAALARGKAVRLQNIEWRRPRLFRRDPFLVALSRLSPGRGLGARLYWTPPHARAVWEHEDYFDQFVLQIYGTRKWTICTRGLPPPADDGKPRIDDTAHSARGSDSSGLGGSPLRRLQGKCVSANLRSGDVLYLPSWTWHWTGGGPKASAHLELGVMPLNGADLVMALGARQRIKEMGHKSLALPLHIWWHINAEDATDRIVLHCTDLPWMDAPRTTAVLCSPPSVKRALQRLSGSSGRTLSGWDADAPARRTQERLPWPKAKRGVGNVLTPLFQVLEPMAHILGAFVVIFALLCFCSALAPQEKRPGRSAQQIRNERKMLRKGRNAATAAIHKKMD